MSQFDQFVEGIVQLIDKWSIQSRIVRKHENPPSAAWHLSLDDKEGLLIYQPTDLKSPYEEGAEFRAEQREGGDEASETR